MNKKSMDTIGNLRELVAAEEEKKGAKSRFIRVKEGTQKYHVSRPTLMKLAVDSGALIKIGTTIIIDDPVLEKYVESYKVPSPYGGMN